MESTRWELYANGNVRLVYLRMFHMLTFLNRAAAGCRGIEPIQYTYHIEASCKRLAEIQQYDTDKMLIHLCRLQNITLKIHDIYDAPEDGTSSANVPLKMRVKLLEKELDIVKQSIPQDDQHICMNPLYPVPNIIIPC